jgi:NAD(P)H-dependent flavin oxidoreductase YrpB (nitropropane dioxygenase family)
MNSPVCEMFDIEFPLLAFSHCRDVVVEVSKAGGMGVLGAASMTAAQLEIELNWIDDHIQGKPYGVDLIVPESMLGKGETPRVEKLLAMIPGQHKDFVEHVLSSHQIDASDIDDIARARYLWAALNLSDEGALDLLKVAFAHPIKLIANALGVPPPYMLEMARDNHVVAAALVGSKEHAIRQVQAGVDLLIVSGTEGGGHCGNVSSMVLIPEVVAAIKPYGQVPILAAGGIVTGRQMAAAMAMGASGAWTGSVWLTTIEAELPKAVKEKMLKAGSGDTVRSKSRTGKYSRQLRSEWTEAWEQPGSPEPLPMPLQTVVTGPALEKIDKLADGGHAGARALATYWVGQGVGMMNNTLSVRAVVQEFKEDFLAAYERLSAFVESVG